MLIPHFFVPTGKTFENKRSISVVSATEMDHLTTFCAVGTLRLTCRLSGQFQCPPIILLLPQVVYERHNLLVGLKSTLVEGIVMNYFIFGADLSGLGPCNGISNDHCVIDL